MRNIEKKCLQGLKTDKITCLLTRYAFKKMFVETSHKLLKIISSKNEIKTKSKKFLL